MKSARRHGIMFHHFHGGAHRPTQGSISAQDLEKIIAYLGRHNILSAEEWADKAIAGNLEPNQVCLTFDDNLRSQFDVAVPVLEKHGIQAFFFVYTSVLEGKAVKVELYRHYRETLFPDVSSFYAHFFSELKESKLASEVLVRLAGFDPGEYLSAFPFYSAEDRRFRYVRDEILGQSRYESFMDELIASSSIDIHRIHQTLWMDESCLRQLTDAGHAIGLHSHTHPTRIGELSKTVQAAEYEKNFLRLKAITGHAPKAMSHPCNSYSGETLEVLRQLGVQLGFCSNMKVYGSSALEFPREDHANLLRVAGLA